MKPNLPTTTKARMVGCMCFLGLALLARPASADPITYTMSLDNGAPDSILSLAINGLDGTIVKKVDQLSTILFDDALTGTRLTTVDFAEFNGTQQIGTIEFSDVLFTLIKHSGRTTNPIETDSFVAKRETFIPTAVPEPAAFGLGVLLLAGLPLWQRLRDLA